MIYTFQGNVSMFQCGQYWSWNFTSNFWCFTQEEMRVYHYVNTQFLLNFSVLCCYWKWLFIPFRTMFQCFNVASIGPEISFRSFDVSHRRRWGGDTIILTPSSYSFFVFFVSTKNYDLYHLFQCFNVASIGPSLSFWSFDVSCIGQYECDIAHQSMYIQGGTLIKIRYLGSNFFSHQVLGDLPTYVIRHIAIYGNMTSSLLVLSALSW